MLYLIDRQGTLILANESGYNNLGYSADELAGKSIFNFYYQKDIPYIKAQLNNSTQNTGVLYEWLFSKIKKDGSTVWVKESAKSFLGEDNNISTLISSLDITDIKAIEAELNKFQQAVQQSPVSVIFTDLEGTIEYVNPKFSELTGYTQKELIGKNSRILKGDQTSIEFYKKMWETILSGKEWKGVFKNIKKNKEPYWESAFIKGVKDHDGNISYFVGVKEDITDNVKSKENALLNEEHLLTLIESLPDAIFFKDGEGRWQIINGVAKKLFRLDHIDWKGKTDIELAKINSSLSDAHLRCLDSDSRAWQNGKLTQGEEFLPDPNGKQHFFDTIKVPIFNESGAKKGLVIVARDITERKENETEQKFNQLVQEELNKILKISLESLPIKECLDEILKIVVETPFINLLHQGRIFLTDETGNALDLISQFNFLPEVNSLCDKINFGVCVCGNAAMQQKAIYLDGINPIDGIEYIGSKLEGHYAVPIISHKKSLGVLLVYLEKGHVQNSKEILFLESVADIIAGTINRKKAEAQLSQSIDFLENIDRINNILQNAGLNEKEELIHDVVNEIAAIFSADRTWLLYPCDPNAAVCSVPFECTNPEFPGAFAMGAELPVNDEFKLIFNLGLETNDPVIFDHTSMKEKATQMALQFDIQSAIGICLRPKNGKPWLLGMHQCSYPRIWTENEKKLLKQIAERFSNSLNSMLLLDELKNSEAQYKTLAETARDIIISYDLKGHLIYINNVGLDFFGLNEDNFSKSNIFEFLPDEEKGNLIKLLIERMLGNQRSRLTEINMKNASGQLIPFESNSSPLIREGNVTGFIAFMRNISERKITEEKLIKQNTELKIINEELDRFVYSTSHDLRAPLTSVMGLISLAQESVDNDSELYSYMDMMEKSINRLDSVIKNILEYSKTNRLEIKIDLLNVEDIYRNIIEGINYILSQNKVMLFSEFDAQAPFYSDKTRVATVISNLITNSIKYRRQNVTPYVKFSFTSNEQEAIIIVADNGEGIPENKHKQIFEMFYRNSTSAEGSGLGLYIVKQNIVKLGVL